MASPFQVRLRTVRGVRDKARSNIEKDDRGRPAKISTATKRIATSGKVVAAIQAVKEPYGGKKLKLTAWDQMVVNGLERSEGSDHRSTCGRSNEIRQGCTTTQGVELETPDLVQVSSMTNSCRQWSTTGLISPASDGDPRQILWFADKWLEDPTISTLN